MTVKFASILEPINRELGYHKIRLWPNPFPSQQAWTEGAAWGLRYARDLIRRKEILSRQFSLENDQCNESSPTS
jgi:hypothetical protein